MAPQKKKGKGKQADQGSPQPQMTVAGSSSSFANLPFRGAQQGTSSEPEFMKTRGKINRCNLDIPSHRDEGGVNQFPASRELNHKRAHLEFDLHNKGCSLHEQDHTNLRKQREERFQGDASAVYDFHTIRPHLATNPDTKLLILTNHFKVTIPGGKALYEYHVQHIPAKASRAKRRMLILDMIEIDADLFKVRDLIATDYREKIISLAPLFDKTAPQPGECVGQVDVNFFEPGSRAAPAQVKLNVVYIAKHGLDGLRDYVEGKNESYTDTGAKEALNIVIAKSVTDPISNVDTFQVGDNRFFYRPGWQDIQGGRGINDTGLISIRGYFSTIRPAMNSILLNVNIAHSLFYKAQGLYKYMDRKADIDALKSHLCGLRVALNFDRSQAEGEEEDSNSTARRNKILSNLGDTPEHQTFSTDTGANMVVWNHLKTKYGNVKNDMGEQAVNDLDKLLPTANVGQRKRHKKFYLPRQLDVVADQLYRGQLSGELTTAMINVAKKSPEANYHAIVEEGLRCLRLLPNKPQSTMMQSLGMTIEPKLVQLPARLIPHPKVMYRDRGAEKFQTATSGYWNIPDEAQFQDPAQASDQGVTRIFQARDTFTRKDNGPTKPSVSDYVKGLLSAYSDLGGQSPPLHDSVVKIKDWSVDNLERDIRRNCKESDLVIAVFPRKNRDQRVNHTNFRIATDQRVGILSICLCKGKMDNLFGDDGFNTTQAQEWPQKIADYFRNVAMKLNVRSGGINHVISRDSLPLVGQTAQCDTMILGADVTHPSPGSLRGTPSIAAVVGSIDEHFTLFAGQTRLNPPRTEIIHSMGTMARALLNTWSKANGGRMPARILFYRDGVGDSQYAQVREVEVDAIRSAWKEYKNNLLDGKKKKTPPPLPQDLEITAVVVTKRHHTRLYPTPLPEPKPTDKTSNTARDNAELTMTKSRNCMPGTVADTAITSPYHLDFFLLSHNVPGPLGTAKPTHYFVLENEIGFSSQQLQDLTFNLCFTYCKSTTSVRYVPATYYADKLCERSRMYLQPLLDRAKELREQEMSEDAVLKEAEKVFYRGGGNRGQGREGTPANPWHKNLEEVMFWL